LKNYIATIREEGRKGRAAKTQERVGRTGEKVRKGRERNRGEGTLEELAGIDRNSWANS
jgi:hypothetical protein